MFEENEGVVEKSPLYKEGQFIHYAKDNKWGHWDLNPDQRVSSTQGATPCELMGHRSSYSSPDQ
jgi:hypothetical protein